jgi:uncharacterized protein
MPPIVSAARRALAGRGSGSTPALVLLALLAGPWLGGCAWLDQRQREIALRPSPTQPAHVEAASSLWRDGDVREIVQLPAGQQLALWWLPAASAEAPALLYLHGTFRNLYQNAPKIAALREAGFAVLAVDYRGWGDSTALVPDEETIASDARRAWAELQRRQPDATRRVIYGHSMGGAVAVRLASTLQGGRDYGALVLESTFTRMPDVAAEAGWVGRIGAAVTTLEFDSLSRIGRIDAPILMLHGEADNTVPVQLGRRLRDAAPPGRARWVEFPGGGHSRLQSEHAAAYQRALRDFLEALPGNAAESAARKTRPAAPAARTTP